MTRSSIAASATPATGTRSVTRASASRRASSSASACMRAAASALACADRGADDDGGGSCATSSPVRLRSAASARARASAAICRASTSSRSRCCRVAASRSMAAASRSRCSSASRASRARACSAARRRLGLAGLVPHDAGLVREQPLALVGARDRLELLARLAADLARGVRGRDHARQRADLGADGARDERAPVDVGLGTAGAAATGTGVW